MRQYFRRPSSVVRLNQGIKPSRYDKGKRGSHRRMDESTWKLRRTGSIFRRRRNETAFPSNLTVSGSEFHTEGAVTETARGSAFVFTRGMLKRLLRLDRSCLRFLASESERRIHMYWLCRRKDLIGNCTHF